MKKYFKAKKLIFTTILSFALIFSNVNFICASYPLSNDIKIISAKDQVSSDFNSIDSMINNIKKLVNKIVNLIQYILDSINKVIIKAKKIL